MASSVCSEVAVMPTFARPSRVASFPNHNKRSSVTTTTTLDAFFQRRMTGHVEAPTNMDILIRSDGSTDGTNVGNQRYRTIILDSRPSYWVARSGKRLVEHIRTKMAEEGRRFLKWNPDNDQYFELTSVSASKQIAHDLRDSLGDLTEKTKNKRSVPPEGQSLDGCGSEPLPLRSRSKSLDRTLDMEGRSTKRTKYEHPAEVGSVAKSSGSVLTDDSGWDYSKESEGGIPDIEPVPFHPMMFPYHISTGISNHGMRSHGSSSTLATNEFAAEEVVEMLRPLVEVDFVASANGQLAHQRIGGAASVSKSIGSSIPNKSIGSDTQLAKEAKFMRLETQSHAPMKRKARESILQPPIPLEVDLLPLEETIGNLDEEDTPETAVANERKGRDGEQSPPANREKSQSVEGTSPEDKDDDSPHDMDAFFVMEGVKGGRGGKASLLFKGNTKKPKAQKKEARRKERKRHRSGFD